MPYVDCAGGQLYYEIFDHVAPWETRRETIIFHHGIGAHPGIWTEWLPVLMDRYRVVRFDMRGYGRSHIPPPNFKWSLDLLSDDLLAVADAAGAQRAHYVGESIGGTIALYDAIRHAARVATLTISNGAHLGASVLGADAWRKQINEQGIKAWSDQFMKDRFYDGALEEPKRAWYAARQEEWKRDSILNALAVLVGTDLRPQLPQLRCPVLLMHGDSSPFIPAKIMTDLHKNIPGSRLQIFAHARHGLPFSHARQCARTLREFLDSSA